MRAYILTDRERGLLNRFVKTGEKLNGFSLLIHYLKKNREALQRDMKLIEKVLGSIEE